MSHPSLPDLFHWSKEPLHFRDLRAPEPVDPSAQEYEWRVFHKPRGLWLCPDSEDNWPNWCTDNECFLDDLQHCTQVVLDPAARILVLDSAEAIDAFSADWVIVPPRLRGVLTIRTSLYVDWPTLANHYQGIAIIPYFYERRLDGDARWYYTWDCASACIWDPACINELRPRPDMVHSFRRHLAPPDNPVIA